MLYNSQASVIMISLRHIAGSLMFRRHPQNQFVNNNNKVVFECFANGSDSVNITWLKNGASLSRGNIMASDHGSKLAINRARVSDSGKYQCRATNADGDSTTSNEAELISNVHLTNSVLLIICIFTVLPQILTNLSDVTVLTGKSTLLKCNALGTKVQYHWLKNDRVLSGSNFKTLRINNINESHEGTYKCEASNRGGQDVSNPAMITVFGM